MRDYSYVPAISRFAHAKSSPGMLGLVFFSPFFGGSPRMTEPLRRGSPRVTEPLRRGSPRVMEPLRKTGLWQSGASARCENWTYGRNATAITPLFATGARRTAGRSSRRLPQPHFAQRSRAEDCHNPISHNARGRQIATTPFRTTLAGGRLPQPHFSQRSRAEDCHNPISRNAHSRKIATTPRTTTLHAQRLARAGCHNPEIGNASRAAATAPARPARHQSAT